jgi:hypothetical protein
LAAAHHRAGSVKKISMQLTVRMVFYLDSRPRQVDAVKRRGGRMQAKKQAKLLEVSMDLEEVHDCMDVMLLEFGEVHIETLCQLLRMTNLAEYEFAHICCKRRLLA